MIKVLVITSGLTHGGVNKSLQNMLGVLGNSTYYFEIYPIYCNGPYREIFKQFNLITGDVALPKVFPLKKYFTCDSTKGDMCRKLADLYTKIGIHLLPKGYAKRVGGHLSKNNYDVVISFQEGYTTRFATYIKASKHIAWVHCDYARYICDKRKNEVDIYQKFDYIVAVSKYTAKSFAMINPSISEKVVPIHNLIDQGKIERLSDIQLVDYQFVRAPLTLISIGRMDPVKRFSAIPLIARRLKEKGVIFHWYIVGDGGSEKKRIQAAIREEKVEDEVILLGAKNNPYPYIKNSDFLICPSLSEACPNVVNEGRVLHVPVITTDFPSASEFIEPGVNGFISRIDDIPDVLEMLYRDKKLYENIQSNIIDFNYDNKKIINQIEMILNI